MQGQYTTPLAFQHVPYSPYAMIPGAVLGGDYGGSIGPLPEHPRSLVGAYPGDLSQRTSLVGMTLIGMGLVGGVGALAGWLVGGTKTAALVGALVGLTVPPVAQAMWSE